MTKEKEPKQEILLPAKQPNRAVSPFATQGTPDVVSSFTTGFKAALRRSTNSKIEKEIQSQMDMVRAQTELYNAGGHLQRALGALQDIDATLYEDQAARDAARAEAAGRRADDCDEREHKRTLAAQRRQQELHDAERAVFNAEQELKKQKRVAAAELGRSWAEAARKQHAGSLSVSTPSIREMLDAEYDRLLTEGKHDEALMIKDAIEALDK